VLLLLRYPLIEHQIRSDHLMNIPPTLKFLCLPALLLAVLNLGNVARVEAASFEIADPVEFAKIISTNAVLTTNATVNSWIEGPVWVPGEGGYLVFSDIGHNQLKKLVPPDTLTDFLSPPPDTKANGNAMDLQGRLVSCLAGRASLQVALITNGVTTPLVSQYRDGLKFYSPNDLTIKSDSSIWFTDPGYDSGLPLPPPVGSSVPKGFRPGLYVYRFFETNGNATVLQVITNMTRPNGICLSPDETKLYVADTAKSPGIIRVFNITSDNTVTGGSIFCTVGNGVPDGIKCDADGRIWSSAGDGVEIFAPDGHLIGKIHIPRVANLCFGGPDYKTLYMVGQPLVTSIPVLVPGAISIKHPGVPVR
jgi:gluconolactonase